MFSGEIVSTSIILFQYTKEFSKSDKLKALISTKMIYLIKLLYNNGIRLSTQEEIFTDSIFI